MVIQDGVLVKVKDDDLVNGTVCLPKTLKKIQYSAFTNCKNLTSIIIPPTVISIGYEAFCFCRSLSCVVLSEGLQALEGSAFRNCSSLTSITLPGTLKAIGREVFFGCSLTSIVLPDSIENIGKGCFAGCDKLKSVTLKGREYPVVTALNSLFIVEQQGTSQEYETHGGILYDYKKYDKWHTQAGWIAKRKVCAFGSTMTEAIENVKAIEKRNAFEDFLR